jgi:hypothetical protein
MLLRIPRARWNKPFLSVCFWTCIRLALLKLFSWGGATGYDRLVPREWYLRKAAAQSLLISSRCRFQNIIKAYLWEMLAELLLCCCSWLCLLNSPVDVSYTRWGIPAVFHRWRSVFVFTIKIRNENGISNSNFARLTTLDAGLAISQ